MSLSPSDLKQSLNRLTRDIDKLTSRLRNLPDAVWTAIVETSEMVDTNPDDSKVEFATPDFPERDMPGNPVITLTDLGSATPFQTVEVGSLIYALETLSSAADVSAQIYPVFEVGPKKNRPLTKWVVDMRNLWSSVIDRPFTRDVLEGNAATDAAQFCVDVYAILDPETDKKTVLGKMKTQITADNNLLKKYPHWRKTKK